MKIKLSELRKLYQEYLQETQSQSREICPSPETLLKYSRSKLSKKERSKITNHIARCNSCAQEFKIIYEILDQEQALNQKIAEQLELKGIKSRRKTKLKIKELVRLNRRIVLVFATSLLLAVIATVFFLRFPIKHDYRGAQLNRINLIHPIEGTHLLSKLSFDWTEVPSADYYVLEIFNEELYPAWKSGKLSQDKFIPPPELIELFEYNKTYFWMVTAFLQSGNKVESRLRSFIVKK